MTDTTRLLDYIFLSNLDNAISKIRDANQINTKGIKKVLYRTLFLEGERFPITTQFSELYDSLKKFYDTMPEDTSQSGAIQSIEYIIRKNKLIIDN